MMPIDRQRSLAFGIAFLGLVLFIAANAHLVIVSISSQPDCVQSTKEGVASYRAAKPSC